jgi:enamine deaminase RidA (YjgF/YER057c/UK114 family)
MARRLISSGSVYEDMAGYSRAVVDGDWVFVSGTVGSDFQTRIFPESVSEQAEQSIKNIAWALNEAGASLSDIVRVRVYVTDRAYVGPVSAVLGKHFGAIRPTNTTIICQLPGEEMKVELEVTALKRG